MGERSGLVVECLTRDQRALGLSLTSVAKLWSLKARHIYGSLVLVQPRKTRLCLTERLLMGLKESNQTNKIIIACCCCYSRSMLLTFRLTVDVDVST